MELTTNDLVAQTKQLLNAVRGSSIRIGQNLYEIKQQVQSDWGDFLRDEMDVSESFASKLISIYRSFILEGGIDSSLLEKIDTEKLYLTTRIDGSPEERLAMAQTLTRREIKESKNDQEETPHEHVPMCVVCHIRL